jgi:hypothetical protein
MKKLSTIGLMCAAGLHIIACSSAKVLDSTADTAVIEAEGKSETEAKLEAIKKGRDVLSGDVTETKAAECKPLIRYGGVEVSDVKLNQGGGQQMTPFTDMRCIVFLKKKA